jgi:hypothetical protein
MNNIPYNFYLDKKPYIPQVPMNFWELRDTSEKILVKMAEVSGRDIEELRVNATFNTQYGPLRFGGFGGWNAQLPK